MQLINKFNKEFRLLLCVMDTFSKYAWVVHLKGKKCATITNAFQKILTENQTRYGYTKGVNFIIIIFKNGYKTMI